MEPGEGGRPSAGRVLGFALMVLGLALVAWPAFSYVQGLWHQERLLSAMQEQVPAPEASPVVQELPAPTPAPTVAQPPQQPPQPPPQPAPAPQPSPAPAPAPAPAPPPMLLEIPALGLRQAVLDDVDNRSLDRGPGHYPRTAMPGQEGGNVAIAGHRTIRGVPSFFYRLNLLKAGDPIRITHGGVLYRYQVEELFIVDPQDTYVLNPVGYSALTLTTCDPPGTDERRLIVRARLVSQEPAP